MPFGLTIDQLIQLGLLAAAIVPLLVVSIRTIYGHRAGVRIKIHRLDFAPTYVLAVSQEEGSPAYVAAVGVWFEVMVLNNSKDATTVLGFAGGDPLSSPSQCPTPYFRAVPGTRARVNITETVQPPFQLAAHDARKLFVVCPVQLPRPIGEYLTSVATRGLLSKGPVEPVKNIGAMLEKLTPKLAVELPEFITLRGIQVDSVTSEDPLFRVSGEFVHLDPKFGEFNTDALADFYAHDWKVPSAKLHTVRTPSTLYRVSAMLADGRNVVGQIATQGKPLWFLSSNGSADA